MNLYETGLIFDAQLEDAEIDGQVRKLTDLIESNSGKIEQVDHWGTRRLAYAIKKRSQGHYVFIYYNAPGDLPKLLEKTLRINESCLRFMTVRTDFIPASKKPRPAVKETPAVRPIIPATPDISRPVKDDLEDQDKF